MRRTSFRAERWKHPHGSRLMAQHNIDPQEVAKF